MKHAGRHCAAPARLIADVGAALLLAGLAAFPCDDALAERAGTAFGVNMTLLPPGTQPAAILDPLAGTAWRRIEGPWPGALSFARTGRVARVLTAGAPAADVSYSLALAPSGTGKAEKRGELRIVPASGPAADFFFVLSADGKTLTLTAARTGARGRYVRAGPH